MPENKNSITLRSEEVQEILTAIPGWMIRWGNTIVLFILLSLIGISWMIKYPDVIAAEVMITTSIPPQKEYAKASGKIDTFLVGDNQGVQSQTALALIENTANYQDILLLKSVVDTIHLNRESFDFPIATFPILFLGEVETDFALFENNYDLYLLNKCLQPFRMKH